jgi:hypothetical protein
MHPVNAYESLLPGRLQGPTGELYCNLVGALAESTLQNAESALRLGYPSLCSPDALNDHGAPWGLARAPNEPLSSFRSRLINRFNYAVNLGLDRGIKAALAEFGMSAVDVKSDWVSRYGTRFLHGIIIDQPHPFGGAYPYMWGQDDFLDVWDPAWNDIDTFWDGVFDPVYMQILKHVAETCSPAHSPCAEIIIILNGSIDATTGEPVGSSHVNYIDVFQWRS